MPEAMKVISEQAFAKLLRAIKVNAGTKDEAVGNIREAIGNAVEKNYLDKKAFAIFRSLDRLEDRRLATTLAHLEHYLDIGGLNTRADAQGEMLERAELAETSVADVKQRKARGRPKKTNGDRATMQAAKGRQRQQIAEFEEEGATAN